ncbi:unnamed protein product [Adineta steineri]|uniref:Uncharacterized protein n=1 Tax=Adineta steineri TaxID=433720 RepID=A0A815AS12_9BILA|nr:unnamed protein product [Adineta steineri]CAF1330165.1 unnamed protein product [Adineta steineri]
MNQYPIHKDSYPPSIEPIRIVNKYLPVSPLPSHKIIIERQVPLSQKSQPIIIEKWLSCRAPTKRRLIIESTPPLISRSLQKNTVITYDAPHFHLIKNIHDFGIVHFDPDIYIYTAQHDSQLASNEYVLNSITKIDNHQYSSSSNPGSRSTKHLPGQAASPSSHHPNAGSVIPVQSSARSMNPLLSKQHISIIN